MDGFHSKAKCGKKLLQEVVLYLPYYHPHLTNMQQVYQVLLPHIMKNGHFILRNSFSKPDTLTVSVTHNKTIQNFNISEDRGSFFLLNKHFSTVESLIDFYYLHDVPNIEGIDSVRLLSPITAPRIVRSQSSFCPRSETENDARYVDTKTPRAVSGGASCAASDVRVPLAVSSNRHSMTDKLQNLVSKFRLSTRMKSTSLDEPDSREYRQKETSKNVNVSVESVEVLDQGYDRLKSHKYVNQEQSVKLPAAVDKDNKHSVENSKPQNSLPLATADENLSNNNSNDKSMTQKNEMTYYSTPFDLTDIGKHLREEDVDDSLKCECGLYLEDSELPGGWSIHVSDESSSYGQVFFTGPHNETAWNLPLSVSLQLSPDQQDLIRDLLLKAPTPAMIQQRLERLKK